MERKNKRAVIVGIFVVLALVIFILGVLTLGGQKSLFNKGATINAVFDEVNGLQAGNNVWFAGVKVGTVQKISFTNEGKVAVEMNIEEKSMPMIKKDTKAKVGSDGFIGNKLIVLYGGGASTAVVQSGNTLMVEKAVGMDEMMSTLQSNNQNLLAITGNLKTISSDMAGGKGTIGKLLKDEQLFNDLQQSIVSIRLATANAQGMMANVTGYTAKLNNKGSLANDLVTDTVIFAQLRRTVKEIDALSGKANKVVENLSAASSSLNQGINDPDNSVGVLLHDKQTAANIKATIQNLQSGTQKLDENMEALQHNFLLRGFFRKKAKEEEKAKQ